MNNPSQLESQLGYRFKDQALLRRALTHRSRGGRNNERLEYLGDSILGFVMAEALFVRFPRVAEGDLTRMRSRLVRRETLAAQARSLGMPACLRLGGGALGSGSGDALLADAFEAVVGAVYLDSDLSTVKTVLLKLFTQELAQLSPHTPKDYKTRLQEHLQKHGLPLPLYEVIEQSGKPHALTFTVACKVSALTEPVTAGGASRRSAEQACARRALSLLDLLEADV